MMGSNPGYLLKSFLLSSLTLGIVNAGALPVYDDIESELLNLCEEILWNKSPDSTEKMLNYCQTNNSKSNATTTKDAEWRNWSVEKRLEHSLVKVCKFLIVRIITYFDANCTIHTS